MIQSVSIKRPLAYGRLLIFATCLMLASSVPAQAATYFVAPTGSDANNGSQVAPWKTLQKAANTVKAGDTVNVQPGNYRGFNIVASGTVSAPITFKGEPGAVINQPMTWGGITFGINDSGHSHNIIDGFTITAQPNDPPWYAGISFKRNPNNLDLFLQGNVVRNNVVQLRVVPKGDSSRNHDQLGIFSSHQDGWLVENNTVSGGWDSGIYASNSAKNYIIRGNTVFNVGGNGIHNNGDAGAGAPGINTNALLENNILHDVGFGIGGQALSFDGTQNSVIRNNLIYNARSKGISLYAVNASAGSKNNIVVNNTVLATASAMRMADDSAGNTLINNIFISVSGGSVDMNSADAQGMKSDHNAFYSGVDAAKGRMYGDGSKMSLREWRNYGFGDQHSILATPTALFVSSNDFHLKSGSPAIDRGTATNAPATDIEGHARPAGAAFDIGAYEYGSAAAPARQPGRRRN
jgi:parallel beta-helix repeat protein